MKAVVSSTADDLRTVAGIQSTHHHGVTFAGTGATGQGGLGFWVSLAGGADSPGPQPRIPCSPVSPAAVDLVVLSDYLVADPRMVRDLHSRGVPHLPVRVRDGTGLVGPLVIPGMS
jgi:hypothetical protein